jgi:hypothetical protein
VHSLNELIRHKLIRHKLNILINSAQCCGCPDVLSSHCVCGYAGIHQYAAFQSSEDVNNNWGFSKVVTGDQLDKLSKSSPLSLHVKMLIREGPMQVLLPLPQEICAALLQILNVSSSKHKLGSYGTSGSEFNTEG